MTSVLTPVDPQTLQPAESPPGSLVRAIQDDRDALAYFLLNVGDGDAQVVLLPPDSNDKVRRLLVIDAGVGSKITHLLEALHGQPVSPDQPDPRILTEQPGAPRQIRLLVATHPHLDHIRGLPDLLRRYNGPAGCIDQFWEPGFFFPSPSFHALMTQLEASPWIRRLQPTSGTTCYFDTVKVTVLGPGVGLRTRFDTYGVEVNDSSLTLMVEYPATHLYTATDPADPDRRNRRTTTTRSRKLLLGADAQFTSWAQATIDFPDLHTQQNPVLAQELRAARGRDYLAADVFKASHHGSKHGVNLELLERVGARYLLVSSVAGGGSYNFPHALAMDAAREARQPITSSGAQRLSDHQLGIHVTGATLNDLPATPLGSVAVLLPRSSGRRLRVFRLMDRSNAAIDLLAARELAP